VSAAIGLKIAGEATPGEAEAELDKPFRQLYATHFSLVWRGLKRLGVDESSIEDAVQDVFIIVHRRLSQFEQRSSLKTWIYGIAVRVASDYRRTEQRRSRRVKKLAEYSASEPSSVEPSDEAERHEANRMLHAALAKLDEEERAVLVLIELEQLTVRETAAALDLGVRTCQRRVKKARSTFEEAVRKLLPPEEDHEP
jgi:RNA polymerase sigma-70 factor (ECF subfamily)